MKNKKKDKGFTLVELVIVVLIVAILIAIIIPVTIGIINSNKESDAKMTGRDIMNAVQVGFNELAINNELWYSINGNMGIILNKDRNNKGKSDFVRDNFKSGFIDISNTIPIINILNNIEESSKIVSLYVGAGNVMTYYDGDDINRMYTAYTIVYQLEDSDYVYFYDGKEFTKTWPFTNDINKPSNHDGQSFYLKSNKNIIGKTP